MGAVSPFFAIFSNAIMEPKGGFDHVVEKGFSVSRRSCRGIFVYV